MDEEEEAEIRSKSDWQIAIQSLDKGELQKVAKKQLPPPIKIHLSALDDDLAMLDDASVSSGGSGQANPTDQPVLIRIRVPDLNIEKCLQFQKDEVIWEVKQQCLAALPKVGRRLNFSFSQKIRPDLKISS